MKEFALFMVGACITCTGLGLWKADVQPTWLWLSVVPLGIMYIARSEAFRRWKP